MRQLATLDLETDPFTLGEVPEPFSAGFYDGKRFVSFWGADCIKKMVHFLSREKEPLIIYWHNGGRFDVFWFLEELSEELRIVNGRIIQCYIGEHEIRDSFAIMPFPLDEYQKTKIDYEKMRRHCREQHRDEILSYLRDDCVYLHELVTGFVHEFGDGLTIGGAGMRELKKFHKFKTGSPGFDEKFRKPFYFGGRNQVFKSGVTTGNINIYDVNSMYSHAMEAYLHPIGTDYELSPRCTDNTCFLVVQGQNDGAFPVRTKTGSLDFTVERGVFTPTIHEYQAALETGSFKPRKILKTYGFHDRGTFGEFVQHFYQSRGINKGIVAEAKKRNEIAREAAQRVMFYKYVLNAPYGKFAQNPENYSEWMIRPFAAPPPPYDITCPVHSMKTTNDLGACLCWSPAHIHQGKYIIWEKPVERKTYYNVCTGASITGAARSILLRGIKGATNPYYCDTDSIICESLAGVPISDTELGAWKLEASGRILAIGGKKLYGVYDRTPTERSCDDCPRVAERCQQLCGTIKKAHKGARLTGYQVYTIANGAEVKFENPVPKFRFDGSHIFVSRRIRRTA